MSYPESLLALAGLPETWVADEIGCSPAKVFYLPECNAWLKFSPDSVRTEAAALRYLQGKTHVPRLLLYVEHEDCQYMVTEALNGLPFIDEQILERPEALIHMLAGALRELHALDVSTCPIDQRLAAKLHSWDLEPDLLAELSRDRPEEDLVVTHGDACLPNFFAHNGVYTGCIDLGDAGVCDRWQDLALSLWSLQYNLETKKWGRPFLDAYGIRPDRQKIEYFLRLNLMDPLDVY